MGRLHHVADACLPQKDAEGVLDKPVAELETSGGGLSATEEGVVSEHVHRILAAGATSLLKKHLHAQAVPEQSAVVEAVQGLLEA